MFLSSNTTYVGGVEDLSASLYQSYQEEGWGNIYVTPPYLSRLGKQLAYRSDDVRCSS